MSISDLSETKLNNLDCRQIKAYPSVNSINNGAIHSEENIRWIWNRLCNKPFIVGFSNKEINEQFTGTGAGYGRYPKSSKFHIDGYLFRYAPQEDVSFDNTDVATVSDGNTQFVQRFITSISRNIETDLNKLLGITFENINTMDTNVENVVGYVPITYDNDIWDAIIDEDSETVYGKRFNELLSQKTELSTSLISADKSVIKTDSKTIYYKLIYSNREIWNESLNDFETTPTLHFTDVFGLTYTRTEFRNNTHQYPATLSRFSSMYGDDTIENVAPNSSDNYTKATFNNELYDYTDLYNSSTGERLKILDNNKIKSYSVNLSKIFKSYSTKSDFEELFSTATQSSSNIEIPHGITYYCLRFDNDAELQTLMKTSSVTGIKMPITFMSSEGALTPYGMKLSTGKPDKISVFEGYKHFICRLYAETNNVNFSTMSQSEQETYIDSITMEQLCSWEDVVIDGVTRHGFNYYYNKYIAPYMCLFLQMSYSSLGTACLGFLDGSTPSFKARNSGNLVSQYHGNNVLIQEDDFNIKALISDSIDSGKKFVVDTNVDGASPSISIEQVPISESLRYVDYVKQETSDYDKFKTAIINREQVVYKYLYDYTTVGDALGNNDLSILRFDDPLNYLRGCSIDETKLKSYANNQYIKTFNISIFKGSNLTTLSDFITDPYSQTSNDKVPNGVIRNISINEFLIPSRVGYNDRINKNDNNIIGYINNSVPSEPLMFSLSYHNSASSDSPYYLNHGCNGLNYEYDIITWKCAVPYTVNVYKDSQNYLMGRDTSNGNSSNIYKGLKFQYKLPDEITDNDLYILDLQLITHRVISSYDIETAQSGTEIDKKLTHRKESIIHFSKLYGDDYCTLDEQIDSVAKPMIYEDVYIRDGKPLYIKNNRIYNLIASSGYVDRLDLMYNKNAYSLSDNMKREDNVLKSGMHFKILVHSNDLKNMHININEDYSKGNSIKCNCNVKTNPYQGHEAINFEKFDGMVELDFTCVTKNENGSTSYDKYEFNVIVTEFDNTDFADDVIDVMDEYSVIENEIITVSENSETSVKPNGIYSIESSQTVRDITFSIPDELIELSKTSAVNFKICATQRYYFDENNQGTDNSLHIKFNAPIHIFGDNYYIHKYGNSYTFALNPYTSLYSIGHNINENAPEILYELSGTISNGSVKISIKETVVCDYELNHITKYKSLEAYNIFEIVSTKKSVWKILNEKIKCGNFSNICIGDYVHIKLKNAFKYTDISEVNAFIVGIDHCKESSGKHTIDFMLDGCPNLYNQMYKDLNTDSNFTYNLFVSGDKRVENGRYRGPYISNNNMLIIRLYDKYNNNYPDGTPLDGADWYLEQDDTNIYLLFPKFNCFTTPTTNSNCFKINYHYFDDDGELMTDGIVSNYIIAMTDIHFSIKIKKADLNDRWETFIVVFGCDDIQHNSGLYYLLNSDDGYETVPYFENGDISDELAVKYSDFRTEGVKYNLPTELVNVLTEKNLVPIFRDRVIDMDSTESDVYAPATSSNQWSVTIGTEHNSFSNVKLPPIWCPYEQELLPNNFVSDTSHTNYMRQYPLFQDINNPIFKNLVNGEYYTASPHSESSMFLTRIVKKDNLIYSENVNSKHPDIVSSSISDNRVNILVGFTIGNYDA